MVAPHGEEASEGIPGSKGEGYSKDAENQARKRADQMMRSKLKTFKVPIRYRHSPQILCSVKVKAKNEKEARKAVDEGLRLLKRRTKDLVSS